jgi:hypothetical protein
MELVLLHEQLNQLKQENEELQKKLGTMSQSVSITSKSSKTGFKRTCRLLMCKILILCLATKAGLYTNISALDLNQNLMSNCTVNNTLNKPGK